MKLSSVDLQEFSQVIHEIYRASRKMPLAAFQPWVVERVQTLIHFDTAWWGRASYAPDNNAAPTVHGHFLYGLPDEYVTQWEEIKHTDHIAVRVWENPTKAFISPPNDPDLSKELRAVLEHHNIAQVLCCLVEDPVIALNDKGSLAAERLVDFLSLYRSANTPEFSQADRLMMQSVLPHLAEALSQCFKRYVEEQRLETTTPLTGAMGVADSKGVLHFMEPHFETMMQEEWPGWDGLSLPEGLLHKKTRSSDVFSGSSLLAKTEWLGECTLIKLRAKSPIDGLSEREKTVAKMFADGQTYKEIATGLCRSPATIRNHIQSIYIKLGVKNKAELISLFNTTNSTN